MSAVTVKVMTKSGQLVINNLFSTTTILDLKQRVSSITKIPVADIQIFSGFPPKLVTAALSASLADAKIASGDTITVRQKEINHAGFSLPEVGDLLNVSGGPLMKKVVPADDSCLFTSVGFVFTGKVDLSWGNRLREIIAIEVLQDPETYSEAILGKPPSEYCQWIRNSHSWGGAIELAVLSNFYGLEIAVIDTVNNVINRFGEDKNYNLRSYVMFDGIHYDPIYREVSENGGNIQTLFLTSDCSVLKEAEELALEAYNSKQFTDVNKFTLQCSICRVKLVGQAEAQKHAKTTGHIDFGEVYS